MGYNIWPHCVQGQEERCKKFCVTDFKGVKKIDEICVQQKVTVALLEY